MRKIKFFIVPGFLFLFSSLVFPADYIETVNNGVILLKQGMSEDAIKVFESARSMQPSSSEVYYYLGEAYYSVGRRTEALDNYNKAVELKDTNPEYHYSIALLYLSEGKTEESLEKLNRVVEIAPVSITGKYAGKLRDAIKADIGNREMIQKWLRLEEERKKQLELERQAAQSVRTDGMQPPEFAGMIPGEEEQKEEEKEKLPVEQVIRRIKFGTDTVRQRSSASLRRYEQAELINVSGDIIELVKQIKEPIVRKNLMNALAKATTPEAVTALLNIIQDKEELFDIKIVALDSVKKVKTPEVSGVLRNTLKAMVEKRESDRAAAKKNIQEITAKVDSLEARKIKLNMDAGQEEQKRNEIQQKLQYSDIPPDYMMGPPVAGAPKPLTEKEILKLRTDMQKMEASIKSKREEILKIEAESAELQKQKARYEALLRAQEKKITDITMPAGTLPPVPSPELNMYQGMEQQYMYEETPEDKNEVIFVLQAMRVLGENRDKESLPVIKKGWTEYGVENERIYYLLSLARLGDFSGMPNLVKRLQQDYPQTQPEEEIRLRVGIIETVGEYIVQKADAKIQGLIEFLSEEAAYPEIKGAASSVLASIAKPPAEKK